MKPIRVFKDRTFAAADLPMLREIFEPRRVNMTRKKREPVSIRRRLAPTGGRSALLTSQVQGIRKMLADGYTPAEIAKYFHISYQVARNIALGRTYKEVF
jgi:hypothetical protein